MEYVFPAAVLCLLILLAISTILTSDSSPPEAPLRYTKIPRVVWQTWKTKDEHLIPECLLAARRDAMRLNPHWAFELHDDDDCDRFMRSFSADTQRAYFSLRPGAARADIWRYARLFTSGGFYVDIDASINVSLDDMVQPEDELLYSLEPNKWSLFFTDLPCHPEIKKIPSPSPGWGDDDIALQWAFASSPRNPAIGKALEMCTRAVIACINHDFRGTDNHRSVISLTGPLLFTEALRQTPCPGTRRIGCEFNGALSEKIPGEEVKEDDSDRYTKHPSPYV